MARKYMSGLLMFAAMIFAVAQAQTMQTLPGEPEIDDRVEAAHEQPLDEPLPTGRVVAVDRVAGRITLEFKPMPQFFLEGGTRIFRVEDPASLKGLGPGDKVRFEVERNGRTYTITRIENSN